MAAGIIDDGVRRHLGDGQAHLCAIEAAPDEARAVFGGGDGVVGAAFNLFDAGTSQGGDGGGFEDDGVVVASVVRDAGFAVVVEAPGPDAVALVDGEAVVLPGGDGDDLFGGEAEFAGDEAVEFGAFDDAAAELVLLPGPPGPDVAFDVEGEDVVGAADDAGDVLEGGVEEGRVLDADVRVESKDTIVALPRNLLVDSSSRIRGGWGWLTRNVPQPQTLPSSVTAKVLLSPAAIHVKTVPSGKESLGMAVGVASLGLRPLSLADSSSLLASISLRPPSQVVSLPNAP